MIISRDYLENVVLENESYEPLSILEETIPDLLKYSEYVPIYKFLSEASLISSKGEIAAEKLDKRIIKESKRGLEKFRPKNFSSDHLDQIRDTYSGVEQMAKEEDATRVIHLATCLEEYQLSSDELKVFILENLELLNSSKSHYKTNFGKLICLYDYLKYKRGK